MVHLPLAMLWSALLLLTAGCGLVGGQEDISAVVGPIPEVAIVGDALSTFTPTPLPTVTPLTPVPLPPPLVITAVTEIPAAAVAEPPTIYVPAVVRRYAGNNCDPGDVATASAVQIVEEAVGELMKWYPLTLTVAGPQADEADESPNPFLDYRLQVQFQGPSGQAYNVPGYFAGDGQGNGAGDIWQARFSPDEVGVWRYCVSFRAGDEVAIALETDAGYALPPDGASGMFTVAERDPEAPGFLRWGRLEYVGEHYLKFRDGPYWIKGGTDSPENFLGYAGFDNTFDRGGMIPDFLHAYAPHVDDWREGDPLFVSVDRDYDSRGIIGALNYLSEQHVNSIYFLPMNLGGDGVDTYPFLSAEGTSSANTHYDVSKLHQWDIVLAHAQRMGIALHIVLNETEEANRHWLDDGRLDVERKLFYREMAARFGYLLAIKWNLSEENVFTSDKVDVFADYLRAMDWAGHPIAVHNPHGWYGQYELLLGDDRLPVMAMQYDGDQAGALVEEWRRRSQEAGQPWVIDMDENSPAGIGLGPDNAGYLRKQILYDIYFSGGELEWYAGYYDLPPGGDLNLEDFRTREAMWRYTWYARRFMEENLPFWAMTPADERLVGEAQAFGGGEVLALDDEIFAIYLPAAEPSGVLRVPEGHEYWLRWYDPRTGEFIGEAIGAVASAEGLSLGAPPYSPEADWVVLVTSSPPPFGPPPLPTAYP